MIAEFGDKDERHIVSVFKLIQDLLEPAAESKKSDKGQAKPKNGFRILMEKLPDEHKAKWLAGSALFAAGLVVAVFDTAIEYQTGRANIQSTCLNVLKGFMAVSLFTDLPVALYKFCITLQTTFSVDLIDSFIGANRSADLGTMAEIALKNLGGCSGLLGILTMIALAYCVVKLFFANIKRGGILLCQIAIGSLYMFSIPRGYADGFNSWCKQIFALCLTAFLQTTLLFLGLLTWQTNMLLGLGIMLSASEVPRIAQQFGLDTSVRFNMMSVTHTVNTAVNAGRFVASKLV